MSSSGVQRRKSPLCPRNNLSPTEMQRSIFNISMAYESDTRATQHITTSSNYRNYIHILSPTECARRVFNTGNGRYFREIILVT